MEEIQLKDYMTVRQIVVIVQSALKVGSCPMDCIEFSPVNLSTIFSLLRWSTMY